MHGSCHSCAQCLQWPATSLRVTAKALQGSAQPGPLLGLWLISYCPLPHSAPATLVFLPIKYCRQAPASGRWHLLFSLPGWLFSRYAHGSLPYLIHGCHSRPPTKNCHSQLQPFLFFIFGFISLHGTYYWPIYYIICLFVLSSAFSHYTVNFIKVNVCICFVWWCT